LRPSSKIAHPSLEDASDQAFVRGAFDCELFEFAVLENPHAGFEGLRVDDDFLVHPTDGADQPAHLLHDGTGGSGDPVDNTLIGRDDGDGFEGLLRLGFGHHRLDRFFGGGRGFRLDLELLVGDVGRQAGGQVFRPIDLRRVMLLVDSVGHGVVGDGLGAGHGGLALLRLGNLAHARGRAKPHASTPSA